jgi:hypothetical protein
VGFNPRFRADSGFRSAVWPVMMFMAGAVLLSLGGSGCSGGSNNPLLIVPTSTPTATPTPAPTVTPTPIPISATQAGTALALTHIEAAGKILWTSNRAWLRRLVNQFKATPELLKTSRTSLIAALVAKQFDDAVLQIAGANLVSSPDDADLPPALSPKIRKGISTLAVDLHNFETNGVYGDTRDELPRANCDFTTNPKGSCTPAADTLTIRFNDPAIGNNLTTFFDWTGASTGKSSPTVQAHDPLNPGTIVELPTRLVWQLQANGTTLLNAVIDIQWLPSPCVTGKFLFDVPGSADATGFILGGTSSPRSSMGPLPPACPPLQAPRWKTLPVWAAANPSPPTQARQPMASSRAPPNPAARLKT